jgi:acetyl esterase
MNDRNRIEIGARLSAETRAVLRFREEHGADPFGDADLSYAEIREHYVQERRYWNEGGPEMARSLDVVVPYEERKIRTRVHYPNKTPRNAVIFYLHGGGFIAGSTDTHDRITRLLARHADCVVVSIDYSLSPEAKFPRAIHEIIGVTDHFRGAAAEYGVDQGRIAYAGDSCGASLALAAALWQRDHQCDSSYIRGLLLYYGMFGLRDSRSRRLYGGVRDGLDDESLKFCENAYVEKSGDLHSPYFCFFNNDLTFGVPPCFIAAAEFDPLVDDSAALAGIILGHGAVCEYRVYPGTLHAFLHYSRMLGAAEEALSDGARFFKKCLSKEAV